MESMIIALLVLTLSAGLLLFYLQVLCQRILRCEFDQPYFQAIVSAGQLEFPLIRRTLEEPAEPLNYARLRLILKRDFLSVTYLLKNAANVQRHYSKDEALLIIYFRLMFFSLLARRLLRLGEKAAILKLTAILQYLANVVGQRVSTARFSSLSP